MRYIGIDVAKIIHYFAAVDAEGKIVRKPQPFTNDRAGFDVLGEFLRSLEDDLRIGFEATGHYPTNLKLYLEAQGYEFMECQPNLVKEHIKGHTLRTTKTDAVNALQIAEYMLDLKPKEYRPVSKNFYSNDGLKRLTRHRSSLVHQRSNILVQITNLLDKTFPEYKPLFDNKLSGTALLILKTYGTEKIPMMTLQDFEFIRKYSKGSFTANDYSKLLQAANNTVGQSNELLRIELESLLTMHGYIDERISGIDNEIENIVKSLNPPCYSIKGVGHATAAVIVAEFGDFSRFENVNKALAFAGIDPGISQSGNSSRKGHMTKHGSKYLREALMNVIAPLKIHNPIFSSYYHKKRSEGKSHDCATSHTAKKLLRLVFALHKQNVAYDPDKLR